MENQPAHFETQASDPGRAMQFALINYRAAGIGFLLALPFAVANTIAVTGAMPLYSWLVGLGPHIIFIVIALGFIGGVVALLPLFRKGVDSMRTFFVLNAVIGVGLIVFFTIIGYALGEEIYRCDILKIPDCD